MTKDIDKKFHDMKDYEKSALFMFSELGLALTAWSSIDSHLNEMFAMVVAAEAFDACVASLENIVSFRTKIEATANASEARFGKPSARHYVITQLLDTALKQSKHRNSIAHSGLAIDAGGMGLKPIGKSELKENRFVNKYSESRMKQCVENFRELAEAMNIFNQHLECDNGWGPEPESRRPAPPLLNHIYPHTGRSFAKQRPPLLPSPQ